MIQNFCFTFSIPPAVVIIKSSKYEVSLQIGRAIGVGFGVDKYVAKENTARELTFSLQ